MVPAVDIGDDGFLGLPNECHGQSYGQESQGDHQEHPGLLQNLEDFLEVVREELKLPGQSPCGCEG